MGKTPTLGDRDYLRTMSTAQLRKIRVNTLRSVRELNQYVEAITAVLEERDGEKGESDA